MHDIKFPWFELKGMIFFIKNVIIENSSFDINDATFTFFI